MKKYFLLISLFTLVFLGLGKISVVEAGPTCTSTAPTVPGNTYTCEYSTPPAKCNNLGQTCIGTQDCGGGTQCCICNANPVEPDPVLPIEPVVSSETDCAPGVKPSSGCSCPTGTKNVNDECKSCSADGVCCGISLNTSIPFIGKCIEDGTSAPGPGETSVTGATAFPVLMGSLTKILVTFILIISFVLIIIGGIMIATAGANPGNAAVGKKMIMKVVVGIALLGASGVILRLINPNFFG